MIELIRCTCDNGCDQCNRGWQLYRMTVHSWEVATEYVQVDEFTERPQLVRRPVEFTESWEPAPDDMLPAETYSSPKACPVCGEVADLFVPFDSEDLVAMCWNCMLSRREGKA